jgi:hypothetical protein
MASTPKLLRLMVGVQDLLTVVCLCRCWRPGELPEELDERAYRASIGST